MFVMAYLSFIFLSQRPHLFSLGSELGTGKGLGCFAGGGFFHFSVFLRFSYRMILPVFPVGSPLVESTCAENVDFTAKNRQAHILKERVVL